MAFTPIPIGSPSWGTPVNSAFASQDARITALESLTAGGAVTLPPNWNANWKAKRANAGISGAKIMAVGDSITHGYYASNLKTTSWVGRLRSSVQAVHGDGGSGMFSTSSTAVVINPDPAVIAQWTANGSLATTTGTWAAQPLFIGPGITYMRATAAASVTFTVRGTDVRLWYITGGAPRAAWTYSIDGGAAVPVAGVVSATAVAFIDVTGLAPGNHTVTVTWAGGAGDVLDFIGVAGENATGVVVDNLGRSGTQAVQWATNSALTLPWSGGVSNPADLVILGLGINDAGVPATGEAWVRDMARYLSAVKAANQGTTDLILVMHHFGNQANPGIYADYSARARGLASAYGAALVDLWRMGRNSWDYWNGLGYWGNGSNAGPAGTNSVHPGDAGHQYIADVITPLVLA
jgi:lysophospholipase L1-like esterase